MKTITNLEGQKIESLNKIQGGRKKRSYNNSGELADVQKFRGDRLIWVKTIY